MHLRTSLALAAAFVAAGLVGLTSASASGAPVAYIGVNGSTASGTVAIEGVYQSGSASFAGSTYGCSSGSDAGTIARGPVSASADISFTTLNLACSFPTGTMTISLNPGCSVPVDFAGANVADGTTDLAVTGAAVMGTGSCVRVSGLGGFCTANVQGVVNASFDETVMTGGWQHLTYNGSASLANQSGCLGLLTGNFTLNNIVFAIRVAGGTTSGIDFRVSP